MNLVTECPMCGCTNLKDLVVPKGKIAQACQECEWMGEARIPEIQEIKTSKRILIGNGQYHYEIFNKYGHILTVKGGHNTEAQAIEKMNIDLERGKTDVVSGPYTGVLWPDKVLVQGKVFK